MKFGPTDLLTRYDGRVRVFTRLARGRERLMLAVVWRMPRWLVYWAVVRAAAHASDEMPSTVMGQITAVDVLEKWRPPTAPKNAGPDA